MDLALTLSGPTSVVGPGADSIDLFEEVDAEGTTVPNSTAPNSASPSLVDDDSLEDKHYNPANDAVMLDDDESEMKKRFHLLSKQCTPLVASLLHTLLFKTLSHSLASQ